MRELNSKKNEIDLIVIFPKSKGPFIDQCKKNGIKYKIISWPKLLLRASRSSYFFTLILFLFSIPELILFSIRTLLFLRKSEITHVYSTGLKNHLFLGYSQFIYKKSLTLHIRDNIDSWLIRLLLLPLKNNNNIQWVSNSKSTQKSLSPVKSTVIYNGFALEDWNKEKHNHFRKELKLEANIKLVAHVGVMSRWKGQLEFISLAERMLNYTDKVHFLIFGAPIYDTFRDQKYYDEICDRIRDQNLDEHISLMGFRNSIEIMSGIDLLIHTSTRPEPFGRVIVEAMLSHVPVIASPSGGPLEIIKPGETGYLIAPHQTNNLVETAHLLLTNSTLYKKISDLAYADCKENFDIKTQAEKLTEFILKK